MKSNKKETYIDLSTVEALEVQWLMRPLIPLGMITVMEGDPGIGKSYLAMHIAAQVSIGGTLPGVKRLKKGRVLYISAEDDAAYTIRPRIDAMGGDPSQIRIQANYEALDEAGIKALFDEVKKNPPRLIILDPLFAYVPGNADMYRPNVIRALLAALKEIAEYGETAIVIIRHLTKTKRDKAIYQGMGSMDVIGVARSAVLVAQHPDEPDYKVMAHLKHNISERGGSWVYELRKESEGAVPILHWVGSTELTVEDLIGGDDGDRHSARDQAAEFLRGFLKEGPQPARLVEEKAKAAQVARRTLDRAKQELNIVARKTKNGWMWSLPKRVAGKPAR